VRRDPDALTAALAALDRAQLRRQRRDAHGAGLDVFCSNDYLGLARHAELQRAFIAAAEQHGVGSGASHLVSGHGPEHAALEAELAAFLGRERALVFSTGYMANLGVIAALSERDAVVIQDKLNHASLIDAAQLARAKLRRYAHGSAPAASELLAGAGDGDVLVVTDGVFSMDGDCAPLPELAAAASARAAWLVVDDAHGIGVLGPTGRGTCEHFGLSGGAVPVLIGTFGKALGTFGAFVAGDTDLVEYVLQKARTYIYTTALPPAVAAATRAALRVVDREPWRRARVRELTTRFRLRASAAGIVLGHSVTPIQPIVVGASETALAVSATLERAGFWVSAIRPPTVPQGSARLRVTLSAAHDERAVDRLVDVLAEALQAFAPAEAAANDKR
jgi:8-amino-7-oxononanoate synthase